MMKRNTFLKLLTLAMVTCTAQDTLAGPALLTRPLLPVQRSDTIGSPPGDSIPPTLEKSRTDTQHDKTVNERAEDRYDRNTDWKNKDRKDDKRSDQKKEDRKRSDRNTNAPTETNDLRNSHGM